MKYKTWHKKQMKNKKFRKAYYRLLRKENREYSRLIWQEYHQAFVGGDDIKAFRKQLKRERHSVSDAARGIEEIVERWYEAESETTIPPVNIGGQLFVIPPELIGGEGGDAEHIASEVRRINKVFAERLQGEEGKVKG